MAQRLKRTFVVRVASVAVIVVVLVGLVYFMPHAATASARSYTFILKGGVPASGTSLMTVNQGDTVTLRIRSDQDGMLMIHGYEHELEGNGQQLEVTTRAETVLTFVASKSGRYMIHLHSEDRHIEIAQIDIQPR